MVVEQLLRPEALQQLLTFLSESTIYHASLLGGRQLAASLAEGLSAPLIAQLAEELRAAFPSILGKHTLRDGWAFKYDNTLYDTATASAEEDVLVYGTTEEAKAAAQPELEAEALGGEGADLEPTPAFSREEGDLPIHADQGAVSVTLWLVEAAEGGGMRLFQAAAPSAAATGSGGLGRVDIDSSAASYPEVAAQCRASRHDEIHHAPNRMAMFNSDLYHMTLRGSTVRTAPSAAPRLGSCASLGRAWRLWAARCAEGEAAATGGCSHTASAARASRLQRCGCRRLCMQVKQQLLELRCAEEEGDGALLKKTASEVPRHIGEIA